MLNILVKVPPTYPPVIYINTRQEEQLFWWNQKPDISTAMPGVLQALSLAEGCRGGVTATDWHKDTLF